MRTKGPKKEIKKKKTKTKKTKNKKVEANRRLTLLTGTTTTTGGRIATGMHPL